MNKSFSPDFFKIIETIQLGKNFLAIPHVNIDGDDIGSMLALYWGLKKINKNLTPVAFDPIPYIYSFMPGVEKIQKTIPDQKFDAVIMLECSKPERAGLKTELKNLGNTVINLDHHPDSEPYGNLNLVDHSASALGEIIFSILQNLNIELDINIAVSLYVSILTDSGLFQHSNTTAATHKIIAELMRFPIPINEIYKQIYLDADFNSLRLFGLVLSTLSSERGGKVVWAQLSQKMLKETSCFEENTQHFIDSIKNIKNSEISMMFKEAPDGATRVSFRSDVYPVNTLAASFGGGGHAPAAGCTINENMEKAKELVLNKIDELFYNL